MSNLLIKNTLSIQCCTTRSGSLSPFYYIAEVESNTPPKSDSVRDTTGVQISGLDGTFFVLHKLKECEI